MKNKIFKVLIMMPVLFSTMAEAKPDKVKHLPPGLEKKVSRTGQLPPGWQKKLIVGERLVIDVYNKAVIVVPVRRDGTVTVEVGGKIIRLIRATREIVEILN